MFHRIVFILSVLYCATIIWEYKLSKHKLVFHSAQSAGSPSVLEVHNVTCSKYTERMKRIECEFQKIANNHYGISLSLMFNRDLEKTFQVRVWANVMPKNAQKHIRVIDIKVSGCLLLQQMTKNQMLKMLTIELKRVSNLPKSCPLKGNILYRQNNFSVTGVYLPPLGPTFNFTFNVELFEKNKLFGAWQVIGAKIK